MRRRESWGTGKKGEGGRRRVKVGMETHIVRNMKPQAYSHAHYTSMVRQSGQNLHVYSHQHA